MINKPFKRIVRPFKNQIYDSRFVKTKGYAESPIQYIKAFLYIQEDLNKLFRYVEPADINLNTYSYEIHELFIRACIEIEANFKAILKENGYSKKTDWNMSDYKKLNSSSRLSSYIIKINNWNGNRNLISPYSSWSEKEKGLKWYNEYHLCKHDRHNHFAKASFDNLLYAVTGLGILICSQFLGEDFSPLDHLVMEGNNDGWDVVIGNYFCVKYPNNWDENELYNFNISDLTNQADPFQNFNFN
jgi:hypothetical protein